MAKAVTLKNTNNEEVYPITDFSLVNGTANTGKITDGAVTTAKIDSSAVTTAKIADAAVTSAKLDWSSFPDAVVVSTSSNITKYASASYATETFYSEQKTLAAGRYLVLAMYRIANANGGEKWISAQVGTESNLCNQEFQSGTGTMQGVMGMSVTTIPSDGVYTIAFRAGSEVNNATMILYRGSTITLIRIG